MTTIRFELPPFRPPSEANSLLLRATRGCPWNRCAFCGMYKEFKFEIRSAEEVKQDIDSFRLLAEELRAAARRAGFGGQVGDYARYNGIRWLEDVGVRTVFIGDSNSLVMKTDELVEVVRHIYEAFPTVDRVTSYARAKTIARKQPEDLRRLRDAGLTRLHIGLETGDEELLAHMEKGATAGEMIAAGRMAREAGFTVSEYVIIGLGGKERWCEHALGTARVLNAIDPHFIRVRTLVVSPGMALWELVQRGEFTRLSADEALAEERLLIENLNVNSEFVSDHVSNYLDISGNLPQAKEAMLRRIDALLAAPPEQRRRYTQPEELRYL